MNPYDTYVENRLVNVLHQYIIFYVDDYKLIQKYPNVNYSLTIVRHE